MSEDARRITGDVFSAVGVVGNVILFLSQVPLMRRLIAERSATKYSFLPSLTLMCTMSFWSAYTVFVIPAPQLLVANFIGVAVPVGYTVVFLWFSESWSRRGRILAAATVALGLPWAVTLSLFLSHVPDAGNIVGWITAAVNCTFFVAPLKRLYEAARELDISRVPTTLTYVQMVQPVVWIIAASMIKDSFILGVNCIGLAFGWVQLSVIIYVRLKRPDRRVKIIDIEEAAETSVTPSEKPGAATSEDACAIYVASDAAKLEQPDTRPVDAAALGEVHGDISAEDATSDPASCLDDR